MIRAPISFAFALSLAMGLVASPAWAQSVLISGGKVITNAGPAIEGGDVLIQDGRVTAVGKRLALPAGAVRIDATGKWITPGLFAGLTRVGLADIGLDESSDIGTEGEDALGAALDAGPAFNPASASVSVSRAAGVTRAAIAPEGGLFSGRGAIVRLDGNPDSIAASRAFLLLDAGERGAGEAHGSRTSLWPTLDAALDDGASYPAHYRGGQKGLTLNELDAQALAPFARGEGLLLIRAERAADLLQVVALKRRRPALKIAVLGATEGWRVAAQLAQSGIPVLIDPMNALPQSFEQLGARLDNAVLLKGAGVKVSIGLMPGGDEAFQARLVAQHAGNAVANGMRWEDAFAAITAAPADLFGQRGLGRLSPGAIADVVVWDGDPLEVTSAAEHVFISGQEAPLATRQTALLARYRQIVLKPKG